MQAQDTHYMPAAVAVAVAVAVASLEDMVGEAPVLPEGVDMNVAAEDEKAEGRL